MKYTSLFALISVLLLAGCASQNGTVVNSSQSATHTALNQTANNTSPPSGSSGGNGFSLTDNSSLGGSTNGSNSQTQPSAGTGSQVNNTTKTGGSGEQVVDVGGSIPVSGN